MTHASRPQWRLFCLALLMALAVAPLKSQTPALTTISDTVFRANGSPVSCSFRGLRSRPLPERQLLPETPA